MDGSPNLNGGSVDLRNASTGNACFDASQYAFFGREVLEEVELGGLEDEDDNNACSGGLEEEEYQFSSMEDKLEGGGLRSLSDIDELAVTFSELNEANGTRKAHSLGNGTLYSGENQLLTAGSSDWIDQLPLDAENISEKRWCSQTQYPSSHISESNSLYRTSSYPYDHPQQQNKLSDPITVPRSPFPPPGASFEKSPNHPQTSNLPHYASGVQLPFSAPFSSPFSASQLQLAGDPRGFRHVGNMNQLVPSGHSYPGSNHSNMLSRDPSLNLPDISLQQRNHHNNIMNISMLSHQQQQQQRILSLHPSVSNFSQMPSQLRNQIPSPPQIRNHFGQIHGMTDPRDMRTDLVQRRRQNLPFSQAAFGASNQRSNYGWLQFRSKYMSSDELENISRVQHAATHGNDPYVDDYYHQACLAKNTTGSRMRHYFCPSSLHDLSSHSRPNQEPHAFLQVDALGRLPFSSIRRPRPLLDVDSFFGTEDDDPDQKSSAKLLEQEPMLAARITIEDGLCLLLDIDDVDRLLEFSQPKDGGSQLRKQRQELLDELAMSFHLIDPFHSGKSGSPFGLTPADDVIFLRIASLPKGLKLLSRFLHLLLPGSKLTRVVCMAIFRHLRFIFGQLKTISSTRNLASSVSSSVSVMDLNDLSVCLAAVSCSSEQPPLRPMGSSGGDGATVVIKSVLERATALFIDPHAASTCTVPNRTLWQASFDAFFEILIKHCVAKYDTIMQSLRLQSANPSLVAAEAAKTFTNEMPVELLRASLPHTSEHQRKLLQDFAHRSVSVSETGAVKGDDGTQKF